MSELLTVVILPAAVAAILTDIIWNHYHSDDTVSEEYERRMERVQHTEEVFRIQRQFDKLNDRIAALEKGQQKRGK